MKLIEAIAQSHPRRVTTKYGERTVIDAIRPDTGEKVTIWRSGNDEYCQKYVIPSSPITLTLDSKGKYNLVENPAVATRSLRETTNLGQPFPHNPVSVKPIAPQPTAKETESNLSPSQKREIATYIQDMAKLYKYCLEQAESIGVEGEDRQAIATTLFISAQRKFSL